MTKPDASASAVAERIVRAHDPIIVLWMSGCEAVTVNPAYVKAFPGDPFTPAKSVEEFEAKVDQFLSAKRARRPMRCFCEDRESKAPISLTHTDCIHEALWSRLLYDFDDYLGLTLSSLKGIEFLLDNPNRAGSNRLYRMARVHVRRIPPYADRAAELGGDFMEVRMLHAHSIVMPVEDDVPEGRTKIEAQVKFAKSGLVIAEPEAFKVNEDSSPYKEVDQLIRKVLAVLRDERSVAAAEAAMQEGDKKIKENFKHEYAVIHQLVEIVFKRDQVQGDVDVLEARLESLLARLWDAPTIGWPMRRKIEAYLEDRQGPALGSFSTFLESLPAPDVEAFTSLIEPLETREAYDLLYSS